MSTWGVTALLLFGLSVLCLWQYTQACTCVYPHPQRNYCAADFVIKAKVKGSKIFYKKKIETVGNKTIVKRIAHLRLYHVRISKVFKEIPAFKKVSHKHIYTALYSSMCGVEHLHNNTKYVMDGKIRDGKAYISICNIQRKWSDVRLRERKGYAFLYEKNCQCKINNCYTKGCERKHTNQTCNWNIQADDSNCYEQDTMCQLQKRDSQCRWSRTGMWKKCREDVLKKGRSTP